ncbi:holliday junction resolvase [Streptococcus phage Javan420]|nr:holliday junction resolvase [Streptococcus phage Javan420]
MANWRKRCKRLIKNQYNGPKLAGPFRVDVTFYLKAPQKVSKKPTERSKSDRVAEYKAFKNERLYVPKKPDLDNLEKSLYDSVSDAGNIWEDDNAVVEHTTRKFYSENPRIKIRIEEISDDS